MRHGGHVSCTVLVVVSWLEPFVFPEEIALGLAATMGRAIAVQTGEVDRGVESAGVPGLARRIAGLVGHGTDTKTSSTILQHLRHKRHAVHGTVFIQRRQDLFFATDFD